MNFCVTDFGILRISTFLDELNLQLDMDFVQCDISNLGLSGTSSAGPSQGTA